VANANDRRNVEQAGRREKGERKGELEQVRYLMASALGRSLVHRILDFTGADRALPFVPNAMNLAHDTGVQSVGHYLLAEVREACPEQELVMRQEAAQRSKRANLQEELDHEQRD
jgi:hypothetical protein